jgi:very-short-patch-repair endonuclease
MSIRSLTGTPPSDGRFSGQCEHGFEVDGGYHVEPARKRADARRDRRLVKAGYRVVRVPAELVLADSAAAVAVVRRAL